MAHSGQAGQGVPPSFFPGSQNPLLSVWQAFQIACTIFKYGNFHVSTSRRMDIRTEHPTTHILVLMVAETMGY